MGGQDAHPTIKSTRSQALPGNADPEALPPILLLGTASEAEPLDIGSQAEPGNQLHRFPGRAWEPVNCRVLQSALPCPLLCGI